MAKHLKEIEIPFGAKDSELIGWECTIPEGMEAIIVDKKIVVKKIESEDEQKPAWSEDDEEIIKNIIAALNKLSENILSYEPLYQKEINWLKSLRPQNRWKPSDEQMNMLRKFIEYFDVGVNGKEILTTLYQDLKKLKE